MIDTSDADTNIHFDEPQTEKPEVEESVASPLGNAALFIIHHGTIDDQPQTKRRLGSKVDWPLVTEGQQQMHALKKYFSNYGLVPSRMYSGPMQRNLQSTKILTPSFEILEFMREINYGPYDGKPETDLLRGVGPEALRSWEKDATIPPGWKADLLMIRQGWNGLKKLCVDNGGLWGAMASNEIARFSFDGVDNAPESKKLDHGAFGILVYSRKTGKWSCHSWNIKVHGV